MVSLPLAVALVSIAVASLEIVVAGFVLYAGPRRVVNQALAGWMFLKAITFPPGVVGALIDDRRVDYYAQAFLLGPGSFIFLAYFTFLAFALDTPLTRPFRHRWVRILLFEYGVFALVTCLVWPQVTVVEPGRHVEGMGWVWDQSLLFQVGGFVYVLASLFGLAAAISAFRRAPRGSIARRRAKLYFIAFTTQDVGVAIAATYLVVFQDQYIVINLLNMTLQLLFIILVPTALLRFQLFDFDLKLKVGIRRGTVVALFVGIFVLVSAIAQARLQQYGYVVGGVAVALLLLAVGPIRRAGEAIADRILPGVSTAEDYVTRKKVEVYREALRETAATGSAADPERVASLRALRASLGLTHRDHEVILGSLSASSAIRGDARLVPGSTVVGKYRIERELGAGGAGHAFLAMDLRMNRPVVLKTLAGGDPGALVREARAAAAIEHPNVVRMYAVEEVEGKAVLVMEYVDGGSLKERIAAAGSLSENAFANIARDLLLAVEAVHAVGAVHRDIKPSNVFLTRDGRAKLADFGVAHVPGFETTIGGPGPGTAQYMSPEQARGRRATKESDLYSAAATLWEARTGEALVRPAPGEDALQMRARVGLAGKPHQGSAGRGLQAWFRKALAPGPQNRFHSAHAMKAALDSALGRRDAALPLPETVSVA